VTRALIDAGLTVSAIDASEYVDEGESHYYDARKISKR